MKNIILSACILTALSLPAAAQADIGGRYQVAGTNLNGTTYSGEAEITLTSDTTCEISWTTGSTTSAGICMRNDDSFSAAYRMGEDVGLVIYKVSDDGAMQGLWTIAGNGGSGTEVLTPIK
jgi:hypothetical protein